MLSLKQLEASSLGVVPSSALILKISPRGGDRLLYSFNSFNKSYISFDTQSFHYTHF